MTWAECVFNCVACVSAAAAFLGYFYFLYKVGS